MKNLLWDAMACIGIFTTIIWTLTLSRYLWGRFTKWDKSRKTWLMQFISFVGLWAKRKRTGWLLAERADLLTYDAYEQGFSRSKGIGWMKRACLRWLAADRIKKYPDYLTATKEFEVWGGTVNNVTVEHVRAYTEEQAQQIAEKRKPEVKFNMVILRRDGKQ